MRFKGRLITSIAIFFSGFLVLVAQEKPMDFLPLLAIMAWVGIGIIIVRNIENKKEAERAKKGNAEKQARRPDRLRALLLEVFPEAAEDEERLKQLQQPDGKIIFAGQVAGVTFGQRQFKMAKIQACLDDATKYYTIVLRLDREPENKFDPKAIKVLAWTEYEKENERTGDLRTIEKISGTLDMFQKK